jgi:beta-lactam-binding protein with PASTA domain
MSWERFGPAARPTSMDRPAMVRSVVATATIGVLLCAGCDDTDSPIPDVSGQQARSALSHLRQSGYEHFSWAGRTSNEPVGIVLATSPAAGTATPHGSRIRLIMSEGPSRSPSRFVMVPGIGTCDTAPLPPGTPCAGGPVLLPIRR